MDNIIDAPRLTETALDALRTRAESKDAEEYRAAQDQVIAVAKQICCRIIDTSGEGRIVSNIVDRHGYRLNLDYYVGRRPDLLGGSNELCLYYHINHDPVRSEVAWAPAASIDFDPMRDPQLSTAFVHGAVSILIEVCTTRMLDDIAATLRSDHTPIPGFHCDKLVLPTTGRMFSDFGVPPIMPYDADVVSVPYRVRRICKAE